MPTFRVVRELTEVAYIDADNEAEAHKIAEEAQEKLGDETIEVIVHAIEPFAVEDDEPEQEYSFTGTIRIEGGFSDARGDSWEAVRGDIERELRALCNWLNMMREYEPYGFQVGSIDTNEEQIVPIED